MPYANLPGVMVNTVDGGLVARRQPNSKSVLIIGTAGQGPANDPYQVIDRSQAAQVFGYAGNLIKSMEEAAAYSDNIQLFRMGTKPMVLKAVGKQTTNDVVSITNVAITTTKAVYTAANTFQTGAVVTVAGLTKTRFNGSVTVASATSSTFSVNRPAKTILNVSLTDNVATFIVANDFAVADVVTVAGLTTAALNGDLTVASVGTNHFTVALTHADIPAADDSGTATVKTMAGAADTGTATKPNTTSAGFDISFHTVTSDATTRFTMWYKAGVLAVWLDGGLVYSNDAPLGLVDTGEVEFSADPSTGTGVNLGTGTTASTAVPITVQAATEVTPEDAVATPAPTLVSPVTGVGMTNRSALIALRKALAVLEIFQVDMVVSPNATIDCPNIAHNGSATNAKDVLGWLKTVVDADGNSTYQWHDEVTNDQGSTVTAMGGDVTTPTARLLAGFHEVNFAYELARFCEKQTETMGGCIAFVGTAGPSTYKLVDTRNWVGYLPTYDPITGKVAAGKDGKGLLGIPELVGCTTTKLATLCTDKSTGRTPGFFMNDSGEYDGGANQDISGNSLDIGAYVHVVADRAGFSNGFLVGYENNLACAVAGMCSSLDPKRNLTNKTMNVVQLWRPSQPQLDALTFGKVNVLRFMGAGTLPVLLHGFTAATAASDYINLLRVRIKFLVCDVVRKEGMKFIGESTLDGLQLSAMTTSLEARAIELQKRGYVSHMDSTVQVSQAEQRIGHARIYVTFNPADELVQLNAYVGIRRS